MEIIEITDYAGLTAAWPVMRQLRPHLADVAEFQERVARQRANAGYRLFASMADGRPVALAGFRLMDNLVNGLHLYVDDLVTDERLRSGGHGAALIRRLREEAAALHCKRLVLDTPMSNSLGHRFYFRCGLLATALRFAIREGGRTVGAVEHDV